MAISVGSVEVDVIPNTQGIYARLRDGLVPAATKAGGDAGKAAGRSFGPAMQGEVGNIGLSIGQQIGAQIASRIKDAVKDALKQGVTLGGQQAQAAANRQGSQAGGAFARNARARIEAAFRSIPDITIGADTSEADSDIQALRARLEILSSKRIGVDLDAADARAQITDIEEQLRRLGASHPDVTVRADTARARTELAALRAEIDRISADPARVRVETDGSFGQRLRAAVQQAQASLPEINIGADTTPAQIEVMRLRTQLGQLADQRIGIDIDAATALARIQQIQTRLTALSAADADVDVRVDSAAALAQLAAVQAMVNRLDGQTARVDVDTSGALRAVLQLTVAVAGVAAIPAIPVLAAGLGSVTAAATAAGAGIGALGAAAAPAFLDIKNALEAQKSAQDAAASATAKGGQAAATAARQGMQLAGAQQALATAHRNAARQIAQAEQGVTDAVRSAAEANRRASQQVRDAKQRVADTVQQAADRQRTAAEQVERAEEQLADAQRTAQRAQQDLTQARRDAAVELEELSRRVTNAQLSERDAALSVREAQQRLKKTQAADSKSTALERERAQLAYDQAVQRLKDQQSETKKLSAQKRTADKAGVEGSETVKRAQERLAAAQRGVRDQAAGLAKAQQDAARQQVRGQQDIAAAQGKVAEAQRNVTSVQEQGARSVARAQQQLVAAQQSAADSISSAQRQIRSAQLSAAGGADTAAAAQAKYRDALAAMTPAARGTFRAFVSLREAFGAWSRSLQPAIMPIFTRALIGMRNALPGLTPFVLAAARAIGTLQDRVSRGFKSPWWQSFKKDLAGSVEPAIVGLGVSFGRIFKGMGGIIQAFLPHMDSISGTMQRITGRFAAWGSSLKGSAKFERFLAYSSEQAPILASALGDVGRAFFEVARALSPLSGPVLQVLGVLAQGVAELATSMPWLVQGIWLAIVATRVWTIAMAIFNAVSRANPIGLIITGISLLVAAVIYAYKNFTWFRKGVQAAWRGIQVAASFAWNKVLKPTFSAIWTGLQFVGRIAMWLWRKAIGPAFRGIATVGKWLLKIIAVLVVGPIVVAFLLLAKVGRWLWKTAIAPAFRGIATVATWLWKKIIWPYIRAWMAIFRALAKVGKWLWKTALAPAFRGIGAVAKWLWQKVIKPVFGWISDRARWLYRKGIKPQFDAIKKAVGLVVTAFRKAKDGIGKAWNKLKSLTKKPIKWVIDWVYNKGIRGLWNAAAKVLPIKKLNKFNVKGWAGGGYTGDGATHQPAGVVHAGEYVTQKTSTAKIQRHHPGALDYMNRTGRLPGYATGGLVGDHGGIGDWFGGKVKDISKKLKGWVLGGVHTAAKAAAKPIRALISRIPGGKSGFGKLARAVPTGMLNAALSAIKGSEESQMGSGQWVKPVNAKYGTRFGVKGRMWSSGRHTGLDFPAPTGKKVVAVDNGSITSARSGGPYGNHISISHGRGLSSLYAHLSSIVERSGAVKQGQQIGKVGATGNVTGPHLHLEARQKGRPVDPMPYLTGGGGGAGGKGVARWRGVASAVLRELGVYSKYNLNAVLRTIKKESGGNPRAINLWDSNAKRGTPSKGLIQTIDPTFNAYAGKYRGRGPYDPYANIYAGVRYARSRYGSGWAARMSRPGGYDDGGFLQPGLNLAYNGTGRPEPVFTTSQANALMKLANGSVSGKASIGDLNVQVFVGKQEITDIARAEVRTANGELVSTLRAGRRG